jgi:hypothetical protein
MPLSSLQKTPATSWSGHLRLRGTALLAGAVLLLAGCEGPGIRFVANTAIDENGRIARSLTITATPRQKNTPTDLEAYLRLPPADAYEEAEIEPLRVRLKGYWDDPGKVPIDFMKRTAGVGLWARNRVVFRHRDCVLISTFEFEEHFEDIVERAEADEALEEALHLVTDALLAGLQKQFGEEYDLERFNEWVARTLPAMGLELYQAYWEIRRSRRGGLRGEPERAEWDRRLRQLLSEQGLHLEPVFRPAGREVNEERAWAFLDHQLKELTEPAAGPLPELSGKAFQDRVTQKQLIANIRTALEEEFGSVEAFVNTIDPLIPVVMGAFFDKRLRLNHREPDFAFIQQIDLPGHVIQTNGMRDLDGTITWRFDGGDLRLTGKTLWAASYHIDREAIKTLGLPGFPGSLATANRFLKAMRSEDGAVHPALRAVLQRCVEAGSLDPLRDAAVPGLGPKEDPHLASAVSAARAQVLLGVLSAFDRPGSRRPAAGEDESARPDEEGAAEELSVGEANPPEEIGPGGGDGEDGEDGPDRPADGQPGTNSTGAERADPEPSDTPEPIAEPGDFVPPVPDPDELDDDASPSIPDPESRESDTAPEPEPEGEEDPVSDPPPVDSPAPDAEPDLPPDPDWSAAAPPADPAPVSAPDLDD